MSPTCAVSVIIPCYRCTATLERAVASVAAQTLRPAELILVDDGSDDGTPELLRQLCASYPQGWIRTIFLPGNQGAGSARNAGWAAACQTFVAFLDADDTWHHRKLELQYAYMAAHETVALSGHDFRVLQPDRMPSWPLREPLAVPLRKWLVILKNPFVTPSVMVRRDIPQRFLERQRYMEDHMLWMLVACSGARVVKLSAAMAAIYKNPFGVRGLSSNIWRMERGDLGNYLRLHERRHINTLQFSLLVLYSALKYVRRVVLYGAYLRWQK